MPLSPERMREYAKDYLKDPDKAAQRKQRQREWYQRNRAKVIERDRQRTRELRKEKEMREMRALLKTISDHEPTPNDEQN